MIHPSQLTIYSLGFLAVLQSTTLSLEIEANNQPTDKTTPVDSSKSEQKTSSAEMLGGKCGGLSAVLEKDDTVGGVVDGVKGLVEEQTGLKIASIDIHSYKKQLVAGMNYFVKVSYGLFSLYEVLYF